MIESLRKMVYFGIGAAAISADRMREMIDDLVNRGEMTREEGKKMFDEFTSHAEKEGRELDKRIKNQIHDMLKDIGVADRAQISRLEKKIDTLEHQMEELSAHHAETEHKMTSHK